jgi:hypothetical protein
MATPLDVPELLLALERELRMAQFGLEYVEELERIRIRLWAHRYESRELLELERFVALIVNLVNRGDPWSVVGSLVAVRLRRLALSQEVTQ